jgi:hypothetical protein
MKVFISHQKADSATASAIARRLQTTHQIECYVDVIDPVLARSGESLGDYLRSEMGKCTQLIAVVSASTKSSQWVPWEIGMATEKQFPLATYLGDGTPTLEFLAKWPYLRSMSDVDEYANASRSAQTVLRKSVLTQDAAQRSATGEFFRTLRAALRQ